MKKYFLAHQQIIGFVREMNTTMPGNLTSQYSNATCEILTNVSAESAGYQLLGFDDSPLPTSPGAAWVGYPSKRDATPNSAAATGTVNWMTEAQARGGTPYLFFTSPADFLYGRERSLAMYVYLEEQLAAARLIFAVQGIHWYETWQKLDPGSFFGRHKQKVVRLNMGCDARKIEYIDPPYAKRGLFHASNLHGYKNFPLLVESVLGIDSPVFVGSEKPGTRGNFVLKSGMPVQNIIGVGPFEHENKSFKSFIRDNCSFYIHTSSLDAQATTILENCARGLVPIVTPESGFRSPFAIYLSNDAAANRSIISNALNMPEREFRERSLGVRKQIEDLHQWDQIYARMTEFVTMTADTGQRITDPGSALS